MTHEFYKLNFRGKVHLWKYLENQSNYPGINFTADKEGCDSVIELLTLLKHSNRKLTRTLTLYPTIQKIASVGMSKSKFKSFNALTLNFIKEKEPVWTIEELLNGEVRISFSRSYLNEMENAIKKVKENEGDFAITDIKQKNILYFWWYIGT